ncbi:MAG: hypothetical protein H7122_09775 [Chitinophagaceae bacterium]|nr:hypothetical protein [Chitinophagaceae bacterium]
MKFFRVLLIAGMVMLQTITAQAQTADEVVTKHIEAIGGKDAWKKVNSLQLEGSISVQGTEVKILLVQLHGKGMRQNITVQGVVGYQIITPTTGWIFMPFQGQTEVSAMSTEDVKRAQNELDTHGSLLEYKEKGHTAELVGKENIGDAECYKIILTLNSGKKETIYIDSKNYYVVKTITTQNANGQEQEIEMNYSVFEKMPEGIILAKSITLPYGTMTLSNVKVNKPVDENIFKPTYDIEKGYEPR